jgi:serine/threonine protein phosphatase PrpC
VADGMGGHDAGEVAAALALQAIVERLTSASEASAASRL